MVESRQMAELILPISVGIGAVLIGRFGGCVLREGVKQALHRFKSLIGWYLVITALCVGAVALAVYLSPPLLWIKLLAIGLSASIGIFVLGAIDQIGRQKT